MRLAHVWKTVLACCIAASCAAPREEAVRGPVQNPNATLRYWTAERMKAAETICVGSACIDDKEPPPDVSTPGGDENGNAQVPAPYQDQRVSRLTGELFFRDTVRNVDAHCSASVVRSESRSLIVTAAHCVLVMVQEDPLPWASVLMFVPAYDGSRPATDPRYAPFGLWPIRRVYVPAILGENPEWSAVPKWDISVISVFPKNGQRIEDVVGEGFSDQVTNNEVFPFANVIGYPGAENYSGGIQYWCASTTLAGGVGGVTTPECRTRPGHSGGPVLIPVDVNEEGEPALSGYEVVGVVHSVTINARLSPDTYPALVAMASAETERSEEEEQRERKGVR